MIGLLVAVGIIGAAVVFLMLRVSWGAFEGMGMDPAPPPPPPRAPLNMQFRIADWTRMAVGEASSSNIPERAIRAAEEVVELAQVCGVPPEQLHRLIEYVYARPPGTASREIAGSMLTLYAVANAFKIDADVALEIELERVRRPEVLERVRRRQLEKREALLTNDANVVLMAAAAARTAACAHSVGNKYGVCGLCGALRCNDGTWEPPIR